jgi:Protein of unknown function (DUF2537)
MTSDATPEPADEPLPGESVASGPPVAPVLVVEPEEHDDDRGGHDDDRGGPAEWRWVQEWRASGEPVPWPQGIALGAFTLLVVASAIFVLTAGVADTPWLAVVLNLVVAGGIGPQLWLARGIPVIRFISWGAALGVPVGWLACFVVPFPA